MPSPITIKNDKITAYFTKLTMVNSFKKGKTIKKQVNVKSYAKHGGSFFTSHARYILVGTSCKFTCNSIIKNPNNKVLINEVNDGSHIFVYI